MQQQQEALGNAPAPAMEPVSNPVSKNNNGQVPESPRTDVYREPSNEPASPVYTPEQQRHINDLIAANRKTAAEKASKEAERRFRDTYGDPQSMSLGQQPAQSNVPHLDEKKIEELVTKKSQEVLQNTFQQFQANALAEQQKKEDQQLANDLAPKLEAAKQKYTDFAEKVDLDVFDGNRDWFKALNSVDNAGDVMYEMIVNSPGKFSTFQNLITSPNPAVRKMGYAQIQTFSQSLKNNDASAAKRIPNAPLSDIHPSTIKNSGVADVTTWSRERYKNQI